MANLCAKHYCFVAIQNENKKTPPANFSATNFSAFMKSVDMVLTITVSLQCRKKMKKIQAEFATCMKTKNSYSRLIIYP